MAAGSTYTPIQSYTASGSSTTISFTSIPSTYTDLILQYTAANAGTYFLIRYNNDSATNYSFTSVYGDGSSAASTRGSSQDSLFGRGTANSTNQMHIQNYSNTTTYKTALMSERDAGAVAQSKVCLWRSTSAINRVDLISGSGNITAGGIFTLYGIAAA
jgi:hypothetical protein